MAQTKKQQLYSKIEHLIIMWDNDGTKTAEALTRQIMEEFRKFLNEGKKNEKF